MAQAELEVVLLGSVNQPFGLAKQAGIHRLATEIRRYGFTVQTIDHFAQLLLLPPEYQEKVLERFLGEHTLVVGISTTMLSLSDPTHELSFWGGVSEDDFKQLMGRMRRLAPNAIFAMGGSQVRWATAGRMASPQIADYYVIGQGERSFLALLNHVKYGDPLHVERYINGTKWLTETTYPYDDFSRAAIEWLPNDFVQPGEVLPLEVARGCVFKCAYCAFPLTGKKWGDLIRDPDTIRNELIENYRLFGTTRYIMMDDTINDSLEKVELLHALFTSLPFQIEWAAYVRLDLIWRFPEMAALLYEAGLRAALFGIETLHAEAGKKVGRGLGPERTKNTLNHCRSVWGDNVHISALLILGLPGEPISSMRETLDWILSPDCPVDNASFAPLHIEVNASDSRIEQDSGRFGYDISAGSYRGSTAINWKSDITDYETILQLFREFDEKVDESATSYYKSVRGWLLFGALSLGFTLDDLKKLPRDQMKQAIVERQRAKTDQYFKGLLDWRPELNIHPSPARSTPFIPPKTEQVQLRK